MLFQQLSQKQRRSSSLRTFSLRISSASKNNPK